mgnify:CR=1 FL=1
MFIVSKRSYAVRLSDGSFYRIPKDFIGEIPEEVAESRLVQRERIHCGPLRDPGPGTFRSRPESGGTAERERHSAGCGGGSRQIFRGTAGNG